MNAIITASPADTVRNAFPFEVEKFQLYGPDRMTTPHYGLFRNDNAQCVGVAVRQGYEPHTTDDVCALVEAASTAFDSNCKVNCYFSDGHYVTVAPGDEYRRSIFGTRDNIWPRMVIRAGYDGRAFRGDCGFYRDACRNLAVIRTAGRVGGTIRHTAQLRQRMPELIEQFRLIASGWEGVVEAARAMEARRLNLATFLRDVYPEPTNPSERTRSSYERRIEAIFSRVYAERMATGRGGIGANWDVSAWEAFNGVQGYVQHSQRRQGNPSEFGRAILALESVDVSRALELALAV